MLVEILGLVVPVAEIPQDLVALVFCLWIYFLLMKGGPYRLDAGHDVHQVSDEVKDNVDEEIKRVDLFDRGKVLTIRQPLKWLVRV